MSTELFEAGYDDTLPFDLDIRSSQMSIPDVNVFEVEEERCAGNSEFNSDFSLFDERSAMKNFPLSFKETAQEDSPDISAARQEELHDDFTNNNIVGEAIGRSREPNMEQVDESTRQGHRAEAPRQDIDESTPGSPDSRLEAPIHSQEQKTVSSSISELSSSYLTASSVVELSTLKAGTFVAGYVFDSSGSGTSNAVQSEKQRHGNSDYRSPSKKRKINSTLWHAIFLADENHMVKFWARAQLNGSKGRIATVKRLENVTSGQFIAMFIQCGPIEVSVSDPSFRRYEACTKDCELSSIKLKTVTPHPLPILPDFKLATPDAYNPTSWEEIDSIVHNGSHSFEVNCTFAVIGLNGRYTTRKARNGSRYLTGFIEDVKGISRFLSIFAHIESFLKVVPEDVNVKHVIITFKRLKIRIMAQTNSSMPSRVGCVTANTSFELSPLTYDQFSNQVAEGEIDFADLEGFE